MHHSRTRRPAARVALTALLGAATAAAGLGRPALAQQTPPGTAGTPELHAGRVAGQVALGTVGTLAGFVGGGLATRTVARRLGASDERASRLAYVGAWSGAALATAGGATLIGRHDNVTGSYTAALGGAVAGGLGSWLLVRLCDDDTGAGSRCGVLSPVAGLAVFLLPSIGATVGFNASREYR